MLGLGLIGAGEFGHFASEVLDRIRGVKLRAVSDVHEQAARKIAARYRVPLYGNYRDLLNDRRVDLVMIMTPNDLHEPMAIASLKAGKHVFCEKPLAIRLAGVRSIFKRAASAKRLVAVDFPLRHNRFYQAIQGNRSRYGRLRSIMVENQATEATIATRWYWQTNRSGGWFLTADIHFYDLGIFLGGWQKPHKISATEYVARGSQRTKAITTHVQFENGGQLYVHHSFTAMPKTAKASVELDFDRAHITIHGWVPTQATITQGNRIKTYHLDRNRETEYHAMVRGGLEALASAIRTKLPQQALMSEETVIASHRIAQLATKLARRVEIA